MRAVFSIGAAVGSAWYSFYGVSRKDIVVVLVLLSYLFFVVVDQIIVVLVISHGD